MEKYSFNDVNNFMKSVHSTKFPYKRDYCSDSDIKKMFKNLQNVDFSNRLFHKYYNIHNINIKSKSLLFIDKPTVLISYPDDYNKFQLLSDMFQEENRMKCKFFSAISSPNDYFRKNVKLLATSIINKNKPITSHNMREELYHTVKECSSFKSSHLSFMIRLFNAKSVLDPCSGWGDRLIACMAEGVRYVGVDPNTELHPKYQEMINFFTPKQNRKKYTMIENTIQNATIPNEKFDLVFTSPPYFKIEQYNNKGRVIDCNEDDWFNNFMKPMISKSCSRINNGGHLVIVINQLPHEKYIQTMIDYIYNNKSNLHYLGVIGYANQKMSNVQPMWIWQKQTKIPVILYNPPMVITEHSVDIGSKTINFKVFRDDELVGGTKQRAMVSVINKIKKDTFIYAGPPQGYAQIALAYACKLTHKKAVLFLTKMPKLTELTKYAMSFNSEKNPDVVSLHEITGNLKKAQECAEKYNKSKPNSYLLSFGGNEPIYLKELKKSLQDAIPRGIKPKRIWLVAGSATILNVLYKIFPTTEFHVVQVGKTIWDDQLELKRTTLYISDERFSDTAIEQPPYPTVKTYDAKLWKYFKRFGKSNDYIWNVGK
jgi:tRNA1(Val) A37 N6-methylase TrmN6